MSKPYVKVEDKHGAVASIYIEPDNYHTVKYTDNAGHDFFLETFNDYSIEKIEQSVLDWAEGRRILS